MLSILSGTIIDMFHEVMQTPDTQTLAFTDTISTGHADATYCGARVYTLSPVYPFLTIVGDVMTLSTNNPAESGTYTPVTLEVKLQNYPTVTLLKTFKADIICSVKSIIWDASMPTAVSVQVGIDP